MNGDHLLRKALSPGGDRRRDELLANYICNKKPTLKVEPLLLQTSAKSL